MPPTLHITSRVVLTRTLLTDVLTWVNNAQQLMSEKGIIGPPLLNATGPSAATGAGAALALPQGVAPCPGAGAAALDPLPLHSSRSADSAEDLEFDELEFPFSDERDEQNEDPGFLN